VKTLLRIRRLSLRYLDVELPLADGIRGRVVERPGLWMSPEALTEVVEQMRTVARRTLSGASLDYGVLTGDVERLDHAILTLIYGPRGEPVAFNALALMDVTLHGVEQEVLHTGLVMVDPDFRSRRLSWALYGLSIMLTYVHRRLKPIWISSVTQVPAVYGMVAESFDQVFPAGDCGARRSYDHLVIARQIMARHRRVFGVAEDAPFDQDRFVIENAYTGGSDNLKKSFVDAAKHRVDIYNRICAETLDYERGDDFLQIGQFKLSTARRYLLGSVPRRSLGWLLRSGFFLLAGSILVPVVHWFSADSHFGGLRPWRG
jgi:hypothetical protein